MVKLFFNHVGISITGASMNLSVLMLTLFLLVELVLRLLPKYNFTVPSLRPAAAVYVFMFGYLFLIPAVSIAFQEPHWTEGMAFM